MGKEGKGMLQFCGGRIVDWSSDRIGVGTAWSSISVGAVSVWEQDLRWVDVWGLGVEDRVRFKVGDGFLNKEGVERGYGFLVGVWGMMSLVRKGESLSLNLDWRVCFLGLGPEGWVTMWWEGCVDRRVLVQRSWRWESTGRSLDSE